MFCISEVNATLIYDPQYPKTLTEELYNPKVKLVRSEQKKNGLLSYCHLLCPSKKAGGEAILLLLGVTTST